MNDKHNIVRTRIYNFFFSLQNSAVLVNSLPIAKSLNSSPKCLEGETFFSLNNISKNLGDEGLDDKNDKYETTNNHIFSEINLDSHSATECLSNSPSTPQPSSTASSPWVFPLGLEDYDKM